jgi:predicted Zn-dependent protease with MMP-like domain
LPRNYRSSSHTHDCFDYKAFEKLISKAIRELPEEFRNKLKNIAIIVEDYPSEELLDQMGVPRYAILPV